MLIMNKFMNKEGKEFLTPEQRKAMKEGETESKLNIDFEALLEERKKLQETKLLGSLEILRLIYSEKDEEIKKYWARVVERVSKETKAFDELKETRIIYNLIQGIENGKYGALLKFVEEDSEEAKELIKKGVVSPSSVASCYVFLKRIYIISKLPSPREMLYDIANFGKFITSKEISILDHELTHLLQWPKERKMRFFIQTAIVECLRSLGAEIIPGLNSIIKHIEKQESRLKALEEIQAYKASEATGFEDWSASELFEHLRKYYDFKEADVLISGIIEIERLRALGLDDKAIAKLVSIAKWDERTATFPLLEKEIEQRAKEKGLDIEDVDNLVIARRIKREIEFEKARIIAQEELKKLAEEKGLLPEKER